MSNSGGIDENVTEDTTTITTRGIRSEVSVPHNMVLLLLLLSVNPTQPGKYSSITTTTTTSDDVTSVETSSDNAHDEEDEGMWWW